MASLSWQDIALQKQNHRNETIAKLSPPVPDVPDELPQDVTSIPGDLLSTRELEITERSPEALVSALAAGEFTSVEVTKAFLRRAAIAQKLVYLPLSCLITIAHT